MFKVIKKHIFTTLTLFVTHMPICSLWYNCYIYHFPWDACTTSCWWILLYLSIYGRGTPKIHHNWGKWGLLCKMRTKWGPFLQFGPHEDRVLNWGPFRTHWGWNGNVQFYSFAESNMSSDDPLEWLESHADNGEGLNNWFLKDVLFLKDWYVRVYRYVCIFWSRSFVQQAFLKADCVPSTWGHLELWLQFRP